MEAGTAQIVDLLERADQHFRDLPQTSDQALSLWNEGLDRLSAALWLYEKEAQKDAAFNP